MTRPASKLSVTIIARNEEAQIGACLESVRWADEIIVVDTGSVDRTLEICHKYTPHVEAAHGKDMRLRRMSRSSSPLAIGSSASMPMSA